MIVTVVTESCFCFIRCRRKKLVISSTATYIKPDKTSSLIMLLLCLHI